jgi:hypothetical protein
MGEVIKLNVEKINNLYRFVEDVIIPENVSVEYGGTLTSIITPYVFLKPVYRYSQDLALKEFKELGITSLKAKDVNLEYLSLFEPVKLSEPKVKLILTYINAKDGLNLFNIGVSLGSSKYNVPAFIYVIRETLEKYLTRLKQFEGKNYYRLKTSNTSAEWTIDLFEKGLSAIGNLLYALYTGDYDGDLVSNGFRGLLDKYGNSFEEVIENAILVEQVV